MRILFVTDLYPIGEENIAKALFYFVQEWINQGHNVDVIRPNFILNTLIRGRKIIDEKTYYEKNTKIYNLNFNTPFFFNVYNKLPKNFSLKDYDVIISHMPCGALMANKLLKKEKIKYICAVHCADIAVLKNFKYILFRNKLKNAYKTADKIAARSPILKTKIERIIPAIRNKTFIAFSGIEKAIINKEIKQFNKNKLRLTTIASLIKRKNIDLIIKTLAKYKKDFHFTIIGDGKQRKELEKLTEKLKLTEKITFTGKIKRNEVITHLQNSDIFILLSDNETFGLSYLEAMATGNIVIGKKNDGIDGILKNEENGFLINPNTEDLKNCIERISNLSYEEYKKIRTKMSHTIENLTQNIAAESYLEKTKNIYKI